VELQGRYSEAQGGIPQKVQLQGRYAEAQGGIPELRGDGATSKCDTLRRKVAFLGGGEKGDTLRRKVQFLSGGEKARLALCKFMVTPATLLVLDEPTNHLDIPTKEMLEEALREFSGTVLAVSHDRYFLRQIVNRVVEVKDKKLQDYSGDYNYYLEKNLEARRKELERESEVEAAAPVVKAKSKMSKAEKELQKKQKAQAFQNKQSQGKVAKNAKRWS
ncbi:unnamed protein product, partial [Closterium sp. Yama58-4]